MHVGPARTTDDGFGGFSAVTEPGTARRFYFDGNVHDARPPVPERYKVPDFGRPERCRRTVGIVTFTWQRD